MTQSGFGATIQGGSKKIIRFVKAESKKKDKALENSVRVTAFQMRKKLQKEIRDGAPGGRRFAPLSYIARRLHGRSPNRKPLRKLASQVRYDVIDQKPFTMAVGFISPSRGSYTLSKSWRKIAERQQEGFETTISDRLRSWVVEKGRRLGTIEGGVTPFFLKKSTTKFKTPARQIVDPFWRKYRESTKRDIKNNFRLKMQGKRI